MKFPDDLVFHHFARVHYPGDPEDWRVDGLAGFRVALQEGYIWQMPRRYTWATMELIQAGYLFMPGRPGRG
jgi:hypothetical protein